MAGEVNLKRVRIATRGGNVYVLSYVTRIWRFKHCAVLWRWQRLLPHVFFRIVAFIVE